MTQNQSPAPAQRVVVTGSDGLIGRILLDAWRGNGRYDVVGLARKPGPYADVIVDIRDLDGLGRGIFRR